MEYHPPKHTSLDILYIDEYLIVINKPSGLLSVPGRGDDKQDCLISRVVIARGKEVESLLSVLFQKRQVNKKYIAVVDGTISPSTGIIDLPLITDWPNRPKQKVDFESGKSSQTEYRALSNDNDSTRIELTPLTGRTHQLRVHMQSLNHAILGDELYAKKEVIEKINESVANYFKKMKFNNLKMKPRERERERERCIPTRT